MIRAGAALLALVVAGAAAGSEVELRHAEDVLDHGFARWRETALRLDWSRPGGPGVAVTSSRVERFEYLDHGFAAAAHAPLGARWDATVEAAASATHHVIPAWVAGGRAQWALGRGFAASGGLRWSRYEAGAISTDVALGSLGVDYYRGPFRLAWNSHVSRVEGTWSSSHAAAWDVFYRRRDRAGVVLSAGRELESVGEGRVLATDVIGAALLGRTALGWAWSVTYGVELQRQGERYARAGGRLGIVREL